MIDFFICRYVFGLGGFVEECWVAHFLSFNFVSDTWNETIDF